MPTFAPTSKTGGLGGFRKIEGQKKPGLRYRKPRLLLREKSAVTVFSHLRVLPVGVTHSAFAGNPGLAPRDTQALAPFPQAFTADAQLARQFGLGHVVLVLQHEMLEVIFQ